jgi:hypothetical protein
MFCAQPEENQPRQGERLTFDNVSTVRHEISPAEIRRIDFYQIQCPQCEVVFVPEKKTK